jgi:hypothetical protein
MFDDEKIINTILLLSDNENLSRINFVPSITSFSPTIISVVTVVTISGTDLGNHTTFTIGG